ncbi:MAG TPA: EAL domain-containing response regulator [Methylophilaceae bacterium]|nr:EAL domain-containing response regulator [Methylophilaceae bacterium]
MTDRILLPELIRSLRTLLVDDDSFMLELLQDMLRDMGFTDITTASDGQQALATMDSMSQPMQLLICDLNMPGMDGIEFFRHLAKRKFDGWMIISSGSDTRLLKTVGSLIKAHHLRFLGSLHKPIVPVHLFATLMKLVETHISPDGDAEIELLSVEEIRTGLANGYIQTYFQPKIAATNKQVLGAECLARWQDPVKGLILPAAFISVAEEHDLIDDLTLIVFTQAMHHLGDWARQGHDLKMSVNISMDNLEWLNMPEQFAQITREAGADISKVMLEMTESRLMSNLATSLEIITRLSLKGFGLSIDDFGTGYASMEKLNQLPFTELKVDKMFVLGAAGDASARAILDLSVRMARSLDMRIVAEGAESQEDWDLVVAAGCDEVQGYVIAKPMPANEFINWKKEWERRWLLS